MTSLDKQKRKRKQRYPIKVPTLRVAHDQPKQGDVFLEDSESHAFGLGICRIWQVEALVLLEKKPEDSAAAATILSTSYVVNTLALFVLRLPGLFTP